MKLHVFGTHPYDRQYLEAVNVQLEQPHSLLFFEARLGPETASLADGADAVCVFVNDSVNAETLTTLSERGVRVVALRCAGFNNVDLVTASRLGIEVVRVPAYSPYAVAEHTVALLLTLNRRIHRAWNRVREGNFSLDGLLGFDLHGRTIGLIGTGRIGAIAGQIFGGFGCRRIAFDSFPSDACRQAGIEYVSLETLFAESDVISIHCPLTPTTHHLINEQTLKQMKRGAVVVNTSRGGIIDTQATIDALKSGHLGGLAIDVYEEEADLFFEDLSNQVIRDDTFTRLLTFPNVLITGHQAFFTHEALTRIAETTLNNLTVIESGQSCPNSVDCASAIAPVASPH